MFKESRKSDKFIKIFLLHNHKILTQLFQSCKRIFSILLLNGLEMLQMFQIAICRSIFTLLSHIWFLFDVLQLLLATKNYQISPLTTFSSPYLSEPTQINRNAVF